MVRKTEDFEWGPGGRHAERCLAAGLDGLPIEPMLSLGSLPGFAEPS